jgi:hypothetical protein
MVALFFVKRRINKKRASEEEILIPGPASHGTDGVKVNTENKAEDAGKGGDTPDNPQEVD